MTITTATRLTARKTNAYRILDVYVLAGKTGLTAEEAAVTANLSLRSCYWKRVSELVQAGYLTVTKATRISDLGRPQRVNKITPAGRAHLKTLKTSGAR
jgi:hypothetical protein